ncbi:hypothetical protein LXA43DRAFT_1104681 [Ganoderma leucocontextum]|nr:hypothetical protein LXA43DRAFT_1104681 [Ganoderma leucocontextum]
MNRFASYDEDGNIVWVPDSPDISSPYRETSTLEVISSLDYHGRRWKPRVRSLGFAVGTTINRGEGLAVQGAVRMFSRLEPSTVEMATSLPPKIYQKLAPAIKGNTGISREMKFATFTEVFCGYFGCALQVRRRGIVKVCPPLNNESSWPWPQTPFFVREPTDGRLGLEDLRRLRVTLKELYNWDRQTIFVRPSTDPGFL